MASLAGASGAAVADLLIEITGDLEVGAGAPYPLSDALRTGSFHHWTTAPHPVLAESGPWYVNYAFAIQAEFEGGTALSAYVPLLPAGRDSVLFRLDSADAGGRLLRIGAIVGRNARWEYTKSQLRSLGNGTMCAWVWSRERCEPVRSDTAAGTPGGSIRFRVWRASSPTGTQASIAVLLGAGVTGTPARDTAVAAGSSVAYSFQPEVGFKNVLVTYDGQPVATSGVVRADSAHAFYVTADRIVTVGGLSPAAQSLYQTARQVLSASDPIAAYKDFLRAAVLHGETLPDSISRRVSAEVAYLAFGQPADSVAVGRVERALMHQVVDLTDIAMVPSAGRSAISRPQLNVVEQEGQGGEPTTFLYVNGIWNLEQDAQETLEELGSVIREIPRFQSSVTFEVRKFYNRTFSEHRWSQQTGLKYCMALLYAMPGRIGEIQSIRSWAVNDCVASGGTPELVADHDLVEAARQVLNVFLDTDHAEEDAVLLSEAIQEIRETGDHVIVVPHSQGNLMTNQAIHRLRYVTRQYRPFVDRSNIAVVSLASPVSAGWAVPTNFFRAIAIKHDVVPTLASYPRTETELTRRADAKLRTAIHPLHRSMLELQYAYQMHSMVPSHLGHDGARLEVQAALNAVYDACAISRLSISRSLEGALGIAQMDRLMATAWNLYGDPLRGRDIAWSVDAPAVVSLHPVDGIQTDILGRSEGTAHVTARWGDVASVATVHVTSARSFSLEGSWSGTWEQVDPSLPYYVGSVTLSLEVKGTEITGTVRYSHPDSVVSGGVTGTLINSSSGERQSATIYMPSGFYQSYISGTLATDGRGNLVGTLGGYNFDRRRFTLTR